MSDDVIRVHVLFEDGDAKKSLVDMEKGSKRTFDTFDRESRKGAAAAGRFGSALKGLLALAGGIGVAQVLRQSTAAYIEQEKSVVRVAGALKLQGITSSAVRKELEEYAAALQKVTTVGDEAALSGMALALNMGATVDQAKELVAAAADLSAAMDMDLGSAVSNLARTLGGMRGELGEKLPGLAQFSAEDLRNNAAIRYVRETFGGFAEGVADSTSGRYQQARNEFGDQLERLGSVVLPVFAGAVELAANALEKIPGFGPPEPTLYDEAVGRLQIAAQSRGSEIKGVNQSLATFGIGALPGPDLDAEIARVRHNWDARRTVQSRLEQLEAEERFLISGDGPRSDRTLREVRAEMREMFARSDSLERRIRAQSESGANRILESGRDVPVRRIQQILDKIGSAGPAFDSAKAFVDSVLAVEDPFEARRKGVRSAYDLFATTEEARLGLPSGKLPDELRDPALAKREEALAAIDWQELAAERPEIAQLADNLGLSVQASLEGALNIAFTGGGARKAWEAFSQGLAASVAASLAQAVTDSLIRTSGLQKAIDAAFLGIFGGGGEAAPAGGTP